MAEKDMRLRAENVAGAKSESGAVNDKDALRQARRAARQERRQRRQEKFYRLHEGDEGHLSDLKVGQSACLLALHNDNPALRRRLLDMGLTKGVTVRVKKIAPLGDPVDIELRGYELCVRKSDLKNIDIKVVAGK